ncbi:MAG: hypothetical protein HDT35_01225 [Clostridiales bacterium]|nr:hypothetical protein [Clostridiales bacterium]
MKLSKRQNDILDKAEDVIQKTLEHYQEMTREMTDKDVYALQMLVITVAKIQAIRENRTAGYVL